MTKKLLLCCIGFISIVIGTAYADTPIVNHRLEVHLNPAEQSLQVTDRITVDEKGVIDFTLHAGLQPQISSSGAKLIKTGEYSAEVALETYRVILQDGQDSFSLSYAGGIAHAFNARTESPGRQQQLLAGTISENGVFLNAAVAWFPRIDGTLQTFLLSVTLPQSWTAVSQGKGPEIGRSTQNRVTWRAAQPQDDIYLIAGQFQFYSRKDKDVESQVFLRQQDSQLAQRYLDVTRHYIQMYEDLIGEYPYAKFALVENFWETGYGMPSFTLLGPRVIRLPFILHSSYPHEILHNWWGNGVYVDYASGNWSEGLTAYLADHLIKEQQGKGVAHRRDALQRYASFVRAGNDFPLNAFISRHSGSSQSVGYDKSLMFFHMLRRKLGDETFIRGLRHFYKKHQFSSAGFSDLRMAFEQFSDTRLSTFFQQWLERTGAPAIAVENVKVTQQDSGFRLQGTLRQTHKDDPFILDVPVLVYLQGQTKPQQFSLSMQGRTKNFSLLLDSRPVRLDVDPWFDLFRQLHSTEAPPTLSKLFGSEAILFVLPAKAPAGLLKEYRNMAQQWAQGYTQASIKLDTELDALPEDRPLWLMGWNNRFSQAFLHGLQSEQFTSESGRISLLGHEIDAGQHSLVLAHSSKNNQVTAWVASESPTSLAGLTRKLPHYGKYSYLAFSGDRPDIQHKGQWSVRRSPLKVVVDDSITAVTEMQPQALWPLSAK